MDEARRRGRRWCWGRGTTCGSAGSAKALIGLSGGIDSALVAAIAVEALGAENVMGVGMPSEYSSWGRLKMLGGWRRILGSVLDAADP